MSDANRTQDLLVYEAKMTNRSSTARTSTGWLLGLLVVTVVLLAIGGESARLLLRYERFAVLEAGQYWRLLTAHLVHGSSTHLALNLGGLMLIAALFPKHLSLSGWLTVLLASLIAIDVGFVWNEPQLAWYVGLSGVLHGCLAAGAVTWWRFETRALAVALTLVIAGKLAWEQWQGALPLSGDMPVIVDAHLYGAIGGTVAALVIQFGKGRWSRSARPL
jgi:rhomboid family GlyGly-CTERM serine protease